MHLLLTPWLGGKWANKAGLWREARSHANQYPDIVDKERQDIMNIGKFCSPPLRAFVCCLSGRAIVQLGLRQLVRESG